MSSWVLSSDKSSLFDLVPDTGIFNFLTALRYSTVIDLMFQVLASDVGVTIPGVDAGNRLAFINDLCSAIIKVGLQQFDNHCRQPFGVVLKQKAS